MDWLDKKIKAIQDCCDAKLHVMTRIPAAIEAIRHAVGRDIRRINEKLGMGMEFVTLDSVFSDRFQVTSSDGAYSSALYFDGDTLELVTITGEGQKEKRYPVGRDGSDEIAFLEGSKRITAERLSQKLLEPLMDSYFRLAE